MSFVEPLSPVHSSQPVIFATRRVGAFVRAPTHDLLLADSARRRNAFIISESARGHRPGQKSADAILKYGGRAWDFFSLGDGGRGCTDPARLHGAAASRYVSRFGRSRR